MNETKPSQFLIFYLYLVLNAIYEHWQQINSDLDYNMWCVSSYVMSDIGEQLMGTTQPAPVFAYLCVSRYSILHNETVAHQLPKNIICCRIRHEIRICLSRFLSHIQQQELIGVSIGSKSRR